MDLENDGYTGFECQGCHKTYSARQELNKHTTQCDEYDRYLKSAGGGKSLSERLKKGFKGRIKSVKRKLRHGSSSESDSEAGRSHDIPSIASDSSERHYGANGASTRLLNIQVSS